MVLIDELIQEVSELENYIIILSVVLCWGVGGGQAYSRTLELPGRKFPHTSCCYITLASSPQLLRGFILFLDLHNILVFLHSQGQVRVQVRVQH